MLCVCNFFSFFVNACFVPAAQAMLIHGANAMGGNTDPDGDRGFGRIHLESAMPFEGEELWALYVEDDDGSTSTVGKVGGVEWGWGGGVGCSWDSPTPSQGEGVRGSKAV